MEVIVTIISFFALLVAIITLRITINFKKDDNYTRRAYLTPSLEIGKINYFAKAYEPLFELSLNNSGSNPLKDLECILFLIDSDYKVIDKIEGLNSINPIPHSDKFILKINGNNESNKMMIGKTKYIKLIVVYYDVLLQTSFDDLFYWEIYPDYKNQVGYLAECNKEDWVKLRLIK